MQVTALLVPSPLWTISTFTASHLFHCNQVVFVVVINVVFVLSLREMTIFTDRSPYGAWWVRRWLIRPIRARKVLAHWGQDNGAGACAEGLMQRAFRAARLVLAVSMRCCSYAAAPLWIALRHADWSCASVSHELWSNPKSSMEALSVSLKRFFWSPWQRTPVCSSP